MSTGVSSRLRFLVGDVSHEASLATTRCASAGCVCAFGQPGGGDPPDDDEIDREFDGLMRKLITYAEDPRTISAAIDLVFVARRSSGSAITPRTRRADHLHRRAPGDVRHNPPDAVADTE